MAEYIEREALRDAVESIDWYSVYKGKLIVGVLNTANALYKASDIYTVIDNAPAADVAPVVRCKDCKHSWEDIGGLCCSHGACVDLTVPGDFYCAYGERAEVTTICQSCGAMMDGEP